MLDLIVIPLGGGRYADITLLVIGLALIIGCLVAYWRYKKSEERAYAKRLAEQHSRDTPR